MRWNERQHHLLAGMGLRIWAPAAPAPSAAGPDVQAHRGESVPAVRSAPPAALVGGEPLAQPVGGIQAAQLPVRRLAPSRPVAAPAPSTPAFAALSGTPGGTSAGTALPPAQAEDLGQLDWPALREAVAGCRACPLCSSRKQTVFGVGNEQAELMIVGEAPGEFEDLQGEPFVGPAGQLLDNMLRTVALTRRAPASDSAEPPAGAPALRQVFIANTLKCRPPRNRNPLPQELARCLPFLYRQIELVRPRLLLASGRYAVKALLDSDEPIGRLRGRVYAYRGIPVIVTYHPSYLLRQPSEKAKAWEDLCLTMQTLNTSPSR